jgi:hypothetical protein
MERLPRGIYSPELRDQAVRLYQGRTDNPPGISEAIIHSERHIKELGDRSSGWQIV